MRREGKSNQNLKIVIFEYVYDNMDDSHDDDQSAGLNQLNTRLGLVLRLDTDGNKE